MQGAWERASNKHLNKHLNKHVDTHLDKHVDDHLSNCFANHFANHSANHVVGDLAGAPDARRTERGRPARPSGLWQAAGHSGAPEACHPEPPTPAGRAPVAVPESGHVQEAAGAGDGTATLEPRHRAGQLASHGRILIWGRSFRDASAAIAVRPSRACDPDTLSMDGRSDPRRVQDR